VPGKGYSFRIGCVEGAGLGRVAEDELSRGSQQACPFFEHRGDVFVDDKSCLDITHSVEELRLRRLPEAPADEPEIAPEGLWSPATAVAPARPRLTALGIFARVAAVTAVAATSFVFGIVFMGVLQQSAQMGSSPTQLAAPSEEKGAPSGERDQIGAPAPSEEPTSRGDSSVPGYDTSSGPGSAAEPTVTIKPFTGTKPHGAAKAYVLTVDDTMVLIAIDREGKVLSARPLAR